MPGALALITLMGGSCDPEDDEQDMTPSGVSITFRTDSGYTYLNDTVGQQDTLHIEATVQEGSDDLEVFMLTVSYDGDTPFGVDTVSMDSVPFVYDAVHITRAEPGQEEVIFNVIEDDGDITHRRLTFTVQ